jgi:hypothetical protein
VKISSSFIQFLGWLLPVLNVLAFVYIQPMVVPYYGFKVPYNYLYLALVFGSPFWFIIPSIVVMLPLVFWSGVKPYKEQLRLWSIRLFVLVNLLVLLLNLLMVYSKAVLNHEPFPKVLYSSISVKAWDCSDLHTGVYKTGYQYIYRDSSFQTEVSLNGKDTTHFSITWLSKNEYRLINLDQARIIHDTIDITITHNTPTFYEGFVRVGKYAVFARVNKWNGSNK